MNKLEADVLTLIMKNGSMNQRQIAQGAGCSLGKANSVIRGLKGRGYLTEGLGVTEQVMEHIAKNRPRNAVILAAGFGLRMVPVNWEVPKGLLVVKGEPLIERLIRQLKESEVSDITVVVGFLKEKYEYLIDKYQVSLVYNPDYAVKNNLHSLALAADRLSNTYIVPCDLWFDQNPFSDTELCSWYGVSTLLSKESPCRISRSRCLVPAGRHHPGNALIGAAYLLAEEAAALRTTLEHLARRNRYGESFWEEALLDKKGSMIVCPRVFMPDEAFEINTYEELRVLDEGSAYSSSSVLALIAREMEVPVRDIEDIQVLKKGMTNRSFRFTCGEKRYIMRIPGEGTEQLVNRSGEYDVYQALKNLEVSDSVLYMSAESGYKITEFYDETRTCDPLDKKDVNACMGLLKKIHEKRIKVGHSFDLFGQIEFYESLWEGKPSVFKDYADTKKKVMSLKPFLDAMPRDWVLTHIDANPDNFLICGNDIRLIDWEYAGMQDPHVDIAMFAIYAMYDKGQVDELISIYFEGDCPEMVRQKLYAYVSVCGLLWSNWCEYKRFYGVEFGEYSLRQYRYAKDFYKLAINIRSS